MLGGSSSINAMVYIRGNPIDYDEWRDAAATGWGYDDLLPYFKRAEDNERGEDEYHGAGGPLTVSEGRSRNPLAEAFVDSAAAAGLRRERGLQRRASQDGVGWYQVTQRGRRALQRRRGLPAPRDGPAQPDGRDARAGPRAAVRGRARRRRRRHAAVARCSCTAPSAR